MSSSVTRPITDNLDVPPRVVVHAAICPNGYHVLAEREVLESSQVLSLRRLPDAAQPSPQLTVRRSELRASEAIQPRSLLSALLPTRANKHQRYVHRRVDFCEPKMWISLLPIPDKLLQWSSHIPASLACGVSHKRSTGTARRRSACPPIALRGSCRFPLARVVSKPRSAPGLVRA